MTINPKLRDPQTEMLFKAILFLTTVEECYMFFEDVCTITELKALAQRFQVARMLRKGKTYNEIVEETGASSATISRVNRCIHYGADGYNLVLERMDDTEKDGQECEAE